MPQSTKDAQSINGIFALFKGESGGGKTVGALSFPNVYHMDFDRKMPAIARKHFPDKEIHFDTFENIFEVAKKLEEFETQGCPYDTLVCDSLTSLVVMTLNTVGKTKGDNIMTMLGTQTKGGSLELMSIDYYNGETNFIERYFIDKLKALWARPGKPHHVILLAHVLVTESAPDLKTKQVSITRSIVTAGKKVASYVPSQFDEMYHFGHERNFETNSIIRYCYTENTGIDSAKTAYRFPTKIDFTNKSLYDELKKYAILEPPAPPEVK